MMDEPVVLTVSQLNLYLRSRFEEDENLANVFVAGEISNFTDHYRSGHFYFSLKDEKCVVRAVMFAQYARRVRFHPEDGMQVIVRGHVGVYEVTGQYQLYVEDMQPNGLGALNLAFEQLKAKLEKEGLFAAERKRPIPRFPHAIGVITSPTGAAVHDILTILERRYPLAEVVFCPVRVQGDGAAEEIAGALERMNRLGRPDVVIVGRGGGSLEDLWPFNEEIVARAVAASAIPVISAVGHETDFTICDFAADLRAPTPSAAAELAAPDRQELLAGVAGLRSRLGSAASSVVQDAERRLSVLAGSRALQNPLNGVELRRVGIDENTARLGDAMRRSAAGFRQRLADCSGRLSALSPLAVLSRGYAVLYGESGGSVSEAAGVREGENVRVRMRDGDLRCTVIGREMRQNKDWKAGAAQHEDQQKHNV